MTSGPKIKIASAPVFSGDAKATTNDTTTKKRIIITLGLSLFCKDAKLANRAIPDQIKRAMITVIGSKTLIWLYAEKSKLIANRHSVNQA